MQKIGVSQLINQIQNNNSWNLNSISHGKTLFNINFSKKERDDAIFLKNKKFLTEVKEKTSLKGMAYERTLKGIEIMKLKNTCRTKKLTSMWAND